MNNTSLQLDKKLKEDVKNYFLSHSNLVIENVDKVIQCNNFTLSVNYDVIDLLGLYDKLYQWKCVSQSLLNLYNNFEFYKDSKIVDEIKRDKRITNLLMKHHITESYWENVQPEQNDVIEALYNYVLYFLIIKHNENSSFREIVEHDVKCYMCDNSIKIGHSICPVCQEPVENSIKKMKELNDINNKCVEIWKDERKKTDVDDLLGGINNGEKDAIDRLPEENNCETNVYRGINNNDDSIEMKYCEKCGIGDVIREGLCRDCLACSLRWKCWYRFCMNENDGSEEYCKHCWLDRHADRTNVTTVDRCKNGRRDKIWICDKCDVINEDCMRFICIKCGMSRIDVKNNNNDDHCNELHNKQMNEKRDDCPISIPEWTCLSCQCLNGGNLVTCMACFTPKFWTCKECNIDNKDSNDRCVGCDVERESIKDRKKKEIDELCKKLSNVTVSTWICKKCSLENKDSIDRCDACGHLKESSAKSGQNEKCDVAKWQCDYELCENINVGDDEFCKHCGLSRHRNKKRGAPVWQRDNGGIVAKWICYECHKINSKWSYICHTYQCRARRDVDFRWCFHCEFANSKYWTMWSCSVCKGSL